MLYDVDFPDGEIKEYSENIIAKKMYAQVDDESHVHNTMEEILYYKKDASAVDKEDMYITTKSVQRLIRQTTLGWKLLFQRKKGTEQWVPWKYLNEYNPVEVAEFA